MRKTAFQHIPLQESRLCCDCECISAGSKACACCGSHALLCLPLILNRQTDTPTLTEAQAMWREPERINHG